MISRRPKKVDDFSVVRDACLQNLPVDVRIIGDQSTELYRSRFLAFDELSSPQSLIIEAPTSKGNIALMRQGQEIKLIFVSQAVIYSCNTQILARERFQLNEEATVPSLRIKAPLSLSMGKLRSFHRLPILKDNSIELSLGIYAKQKDKVQRIRAREKALITDLAGGGLGFCIPEGRSLFLGIDTRVSLSFQLPDDEEPIKLDGRICFYFRRKQLQQIFSGVQFIAVDSDVNFKRSVDRILHFVAKQQRISLGNRKVLR